MLQRRVEADLCPPTLGDKPKRPIGTGVVEPFRVEHVVDIKGPRPVRGNMGPPASEEDGPWCRGFIARGLMGRSQGTGRHMNMRLGTKGPAPLHTALGWGGEWQPQSGGPFPLAQQRCRQGHLVGTQLLGTPAFHPSSQCICLFKTVHQPRMGDGRKGSAGRKHNEVLVRCEKGLQAPRETAVLALGFQLDPKLKCLLRAQAGVPLFKAEGPVMDAIGSELITAWCTGMNRQGGHARPLA